MIKSLNILAKLLKHSLILVLQIVKYYQVLLYDFNNLSFIKIFTLLCNI
jgi:hypothetical protein